MEEDEGKQKSVIFKHTRKRAALGHDSRETSYEDRIDLAISTLVPLPKLESKILRLSCSSNNFKRLFDTPSLVISGSSFWVFFNFCIVNISTESNDVERVFSYRGGFREDMQKKV